MSVNKDFADIVHNSLGELDEIGDNIIFQAGDETKIYHDQMPPLAFPFGYMIISSTFMFYDDEENKDGYEE
jgi:hypothetical protein|tara:strand:+ start:255 stop:467 length:213 start_codon:yes stop_codon:yes gene_type:complete